MSERKRGKLKILMGYAAGVGKTYKMLEEAHGLKGQGIDVVIGYFEPHGRQETIAKAEGLEMIPRKKIEYRGATFEEMDIEAIIARRPQVCAVDEFPHTNVPGSDQSKRWEDVMALLDAGIDVITTMNIQHLESLNDQIKVITGITVRETLPDWIVQQADEVVMVDLTPRALMHRLERGVVYQPEQAERALQNFFREPTLVALRELALREAAHEVGHRIANDEDDLHGNIQPFHHTQAQQKILVYVTADPKTAMLIRRAKRVSDFLRAECLAIVVHPTNTSGSSAGPEWEAIQKHLTFARNLHISTHALTGDDPATLVVDFAHKHRITQIFVIRPTPRTRFLPRSPIQRIIDLAKEIQIVIVSDREHTSP
jgi:two-component system sensor histidine kinase KdpD